MNCESAGGNFLGSNILDRRQFIEGVIYRRKKTLYQYRNRGGFGH